ncbi:transcriptional repressor LexA [soil metagenome]
MQTPTQRQREVLDLIARYIESHGYRPSYQTIARRLGLRSRAGIARIVRDLETQGLLTRTHLDGHFHIEIGTGGSVATIQWLRLPDTSEETEPPLSLPEFMLGGCEAADIRAFRVPDDAMSDEHICGGDIALLELREFARDGQTVVAVLEKERTVLRKYYRAGAEIELVSAGDGGETIRVDPDVIEIKGVLRSLLRPDA